jgi:hypothetical protein
VELTDHGQVREALTGVDERHDAVDAVVHLAAVPAPGLTTNAVTFTNNITATYNVFSAARSAGVRNVDTGPSSETRPHRGPGRRRPVCRRIGRVRHSSLHISIADYLCVGGHVLVFDQPFGDVGDGDGGVAEFGVAGAIAD